MTGVKLPDQAAKRLFQRRLLAWYARHGRDLPWRRTREPYRVLVSEIMLQQTQVDRVIPKYHEFLTRYPTFEDLARARAPARLLPPRDQSSRHRARDRRSLRGAPPGGRRGAAEHERHRPLHGRRDP